MVVFLIGGLSITLLQPIRYSAESRILITQNRGPVDPYVITKTNEYVTKVLSNVVTSDLFFKEVINTDYHINPNYFPIEQTARKEKWLKTVTVMASNDSGIMIIKILHRDKKEAGQIAEAVNYLLKMKSGEYHGIGSAVEIKVLDPPMVSEWPVEPPIVFNLVLSLVLGIILALAYVYFLPEQNYDLKFFPWRAKKEKQERQNQWMSAGELLERKLEFKPMPIPEVKEVKDVRLEKATTEPKEELKELDNIEIDELEERLTYNDFIKKADIRNIL